MNTGAPRVFLVEESRRDDINLSPAETFGKVTYIFNPKDRRAGLFEPDAFAADVIASLERQGFNPDRDYFCFTGKLLTVSLAVFALLKKWRYFNALMYSVTDGIYKKRRLNIKEANGLHTTSNPK